MERAADGSGLNALMRIEEFDFVAVHGNCELLSSAGVLRPENGRLHGATSCLGAMTQDGPTDGVAAFGILDPDGAYGTAMRAFDVDPRAASRRAARDALHAADRIGERPDLVWVSATPGTEEAVLDGIESIVGKDVPIIGGSAADNSVAGGWFVFDGQSRSDDGVVVSVLFPSTGVSFAYQNGYSPTASRGRTKTRLRSCPKAPSGRWAGRSRNWARYRSTFWRIRPWRDATVRSTCSPLSKPERNSP